MWNLYLIVHALLLAAGLSAAHALLSRLRFRRCDNPV